MLVTVATNPFRVAPAITYLILIPGLPKLNPGLELANTFGVIVKALSQGPAYRAGCGSAALRNLCNLRIPRAPTEGRPLQCLQLLFEANLSPIRGIQQA